MASKGRIQTSGRGRSLPADAAILLWADETSRAWPYAETGYTGGKGFKIIGTDLKLWQQGTFAARPAANTVVPTTSYYANDVKVLYFSDGSNWITVSLAGDLATIVAEVTKSNDATETDLVTWSMPANFMITNTTIEMVAWGNYDTPASGVPTLSIRAYIGTQVITSQTITLGASKTGLGFKMEALIICRDGTNVWADSQISDPGGAGANDRQGFDTGTTVTTPALNAIKTVKWTMAWSAAVVGATWRVDGGFIRLRRAGA